VLFRSVRFIRYEYCAGDFSFFLLEPGSESVENIIKTIVRSTKWEPGVISKMYLDDIDHEGLKYWYDDICEEIKKIETPK
jgi:NADP-dependent 3-hydroxy acid dehydrogenase YdfG